MKHIKTFEQFVNESNITKSIGDKIWKVLSKNNYSLQATVEDIIRLNKNYTEHRDEIWDIIEKAKRSNAGIQSVYNDVIGVLEHVNETYYNNESIVTNEGNRTPEGYLKNIKVSSFKSTWTLKDVVDQYDDIIVNYLEDAGVIESSAPISEGAPALNDKGKEEIKKLEKALSLLQDALNHGNWKELYKHAEEAKFRAGLLKNNNYNI